ncbi:hypothetical protein [Cryobacterium sp. AP23]
MTHSSSTSLVARRSIRTGLALTGATLALIGLAGCAPESSAEPTASVAPSATATAEPTATATAEPTETATPEPVVPPAGTAVDKTCEQLLSPDDVYAINPNLGVDPEYAATSDYAVTAATYSGISCGWLNQSSGETFEVALAMPNESLTNTLKDQALATGEIVPTYGSAPDVEGYFSAETTTAQVFTRGYWVTVTDPTLVEPGDAEPILATVLGNL